MTDRSIEIITRPQPQSRRGLLRPFPTEELRHVDPFVFLDMAAPEHIGDGSHVVAPHSHRGVQPVGLVFRGRVEHRDSLGNQITVTSGGMQWLMAGSGVMHEEILAGDDDGVLQAAQLWVNLPAAAKMNPAEHYAVDASDIPEITSLGQGSVLRLFAGTLTGVEGPEPHAASVLLAHVALIPNGTITVDLPTGWNAAATAVAGQPTVGGESLEPGNTVVFRDDGDTVSFGAPSGGQLLLMAGEPIGEPVAMGGGHVMNTPEEVAQAFADERAGHMGHLSATRMEGALT